MLTNQFDLFIGNCSNKIKIFSQSVHIYFHLSIFVSVYLCRLSQFPPSQPESHVLFISLYISSNHLSVLFISLFFIFSRKTFPNLNTFLYPRYKTGANWPRIQRSRHTLRSWHSALPVRRESYEIEMLERPIRRPQTRIVPCLSVLQHSLDHHQQVSNI